MYVVIYDVKQSLLLHSGLDKLYQWSVKWQLNLNLSKCFVLHIGANNPEHTYNINRTELSNALEAVDLGVTVDSKLRFDKHISAMERFKIRRCGVATLHVDIFSVRRMHGRCHVTLGSTVTWPETSGFVWETTAKPEMHGFSGIE